MTVTTTAPSPSSRLAAALAELTERWSPERRAKPRQPPSANVRYRPQPTGRPRDCWEWTLAHCAGWFRSNLQSPVPGVIGPSLRWATAEVDKNEKRSAEPAMAGKAAPAHRPYDEEPF